MYKMQEVSLLFLLSPTVSNRSLLSTVCIQLEATGLMQEAGEGLHLLFGLCLGHWDGLSAAFAATGKTLQMLL